MSYRATAIQVMIASPGDVASERQIVRDVIAEWNAVHSRQDEVVLMPLGWDTHSSPELGHRPQELINERLLRDSDLLVGIFWTRVGSPTGKSISGSVEEIEEHLSLGKPVMLYFSDVPVKAGSIDNEQYEALLDFKKWAMSQGLVETFDSEQEFRAKFSRNLPTTLYSNRYLKELLAKPTATTLPMGYFDLTESSPSPSLRPEALELLTEAAKSDGDILIMEFLGGAQVQAGSKTFSGENRREFARWKSAVEELVEARFIQDRGYKGEVFEVTDAGYSYVEGLEAA